ncbi:MAG: hypothetical protein RIB78_05860 [Gammaproteobacteria bacterium]
MKHLLAAITLLACTTTSAFADEYPSEQTVRYALECMAELGGQTDENLYTCLCRYDNIRAAMPFTEYEEAVTYERNKSMPGEKGGFFRDNERGENFYKVLKEVRKDALSQCPVTKRVTVDKSKLTNSADAKK